MPAAQIYEVELPDGRILEVEGDRPPTRAELARYLPEEKAKPEGVLSRFDRFMRTPVAGNSEFSATNQAPSMSENTMAPGESRATTSADASKFKQLAQAPLLNLPRVTAEDVARLGELQTPDLTTGDFGRDRRIPASVAGGLYNAAAPIIEGLSSPQNIAITAALGGVGKAAQLGVKGARSVLGAAGVGFGAVTAKDTIALAEHAGEVLADPTSSDLQRTEAAAAPVLTGLLSASMLAGGARIGAAEAVPALAQAYPKAFWKRSGLTAEEFAQVYPPTLRRVAANQGTPADVSLVQRVNDAASEAGVSVGALARGRATADVIDWNPRAVTKLLPEDLRPAAPASEVRFGTPAARPSAPVPVPVPVEQAPRPVPGEPLALEQGQNRPSERPPVDERPSAPAQVAPPEPIPAPVDNAPVVATPASLPEPAPLAAPAQTSGVNQAPNVGDTITKPGVGGAPEVAPTAPASKPAITLPDAATAQTWVQRNEARFKSVSIRENPAGGFDVFTVSKGRRPGPGSHPDGETTDIIDHIRSLGGVPPPPKGATGGEWNGFKETFSGEGRALVNGKKRGLGFDQFLGNLAGSDYAHLAGDPGGFYRTVSEAFADRARYKIAKTLEENTAKFQTAILTGKGRGGKEPKAGKTDLSDNLNPGDKFSVKGEPITVTDVDPDGNVILQDGPRFKTQIIPPGVEIHPDARSMKKVPREKPKANTGPQSDDPFGDNFVPEPDVPAAPTPTPTPTPSTQNEFAARSQELQRILRAAGYSKGDGVSTAGLELVSALAKKNKLRQWPDTQTIADYDALIAVVRDDLNLAAGINSPAAAPTPGTQADLVAGIERQAASPTNTGEIIPTQDVPFNLSGETQTVQPSAVETARAAQESAENRARNDAAQRNLFDNPGDPGPLEPGMPPIPPGVPAGNLNYGRMPVAMERIAPGTVDVPTVLDALRAVAKAAGSMTDIREGRFSQNALGIAKSWEEIIRVRQLNNLPTAAHEVGHIVSKAIFGSMKSRPMMRQAFPAPVIKELQAMGKALYGSTKPVAGYTAEGFAELVRLWLSTEDAARRAPLATKWLEETLFPLQSAKGATPSLGQAMRYARDQFDLWRAQGAEGRISAQTKDEPGRWQRVKTWAKENLSGRAVGEEFAPLEELAKAYTATTGNRLAPGENPYMIATALRGTAGAKLETWVDHAMTDINGTVTGPGLREAVAPVRSANAEEFQIYLTVRQAIERLKQGKNPGIEQEDAVYVRDKYEKAHPEFIAAAEGMADWWAGVLNYVEQAWPDKNSQVIAAVRKGNPRYFGPLARVLDSDRVRPGKAEGTGGGIHRFKGSGLPIKKLLLQSLYVAEGMIAQAHRDAIARSVFRLAEVEGMGWIVEEVPITKAMEQVNIEKLRSQLEAMGVDTSAIAPDEMLSYATTRDTPTGIDPIIALDTANGKRWFQVPAMVFEILEGVQEPARLGAVFELFAGMPARAFKLGTTGVRASFSLVTNPARDLPTFMLQSIAGNPASRVAHYFGALAGIVKAGLGGNQSPAWELVHALGLQSSTFLGGDIAQARREAKGMFHGKFYRRITSPVETLREILSFTETAPRLAELEMIGRELGWKPGQPLTRDQAVAMAVAFKRVTTDFSAKGSKWRGFYRSVPFANAAVQGARALGRAFSRDQGTKEKHFAPLRAVLNGLTLLTLPAIWNYWANKDEEWFKMLPWRERYLYLNVSQGRNVYQIPLPPEWASAFAVLPVAALDSWYHDDRKALVNALEHVLSVVNPLDYPVLAKVAKEQWSNKIEFFNRPMVPRGEIDLLPGSQRGPYTSEIGAELGNIFPNQVSPRRFDAAVRAVFGGVGGDVIDAPGALMRALGLKTQIANREMEPSDIPVLGRLARRGGQFTSATQPLTEFWDDYNRYSAWKASNHKAITERTPVLEPMSFQEQAYGMKLALLEPYIKLRMEIASRTPELDKRQAIYKATSERARKLLESKPKSAQNPPIGGKLPLSEP